MLFTSRDSLHEKGHAEENIWARREEATNLERLRYQIDEQLLTE